MLYIKTSEGVEKTGKETERGGREEGKRKERGPGERHRRKLWNAPSLTANGGGKRLAGKKKNEKIRRDCPTVRCSMKQVAG